MDFVLYFDYAAFLIFAFLIASIILKRQLVGTGNKIFLAILIVALIANVLDIVASLTWLDITLLFWLNTFFFAFRCAIAMLLFFYGANLGKVFHKITKRKWPLFITLAPYLILIITLFINPFNKMIFDYLPGPTYVRGPFAWIAYAVGYGYVTAALVIILLSRKSHLKSQVFAVAVAYVLQISASIVQFFVVNMLVEMLITAMTLLSLSMYIESPENFIDYKTGCRSFQSFTNETNQRFDLGNEFGVMLIQIRNTSALYNLYGHKAAIEYTRKFARGIEERIRKADRAALLYYLGDSVFAAIFPKIDLGQACFAKVSQEKFDLVLHEDMPFHFITVSCYAHCPKDCRSTESMISFSTSFFDLTEGNVLKLEAYRQEQGNVLFELDHILERAIHNKAFSLYYQPIYSIKEGRYNSAEALLRLEDPIFGTIMPSLIIPYAENCGKIIDIGNIVLEKSFVFFVSKLRGKLDYLELNVSPLQLIDPGFASSLIAMAKSFGVEPKEIILEITESAAMPDDPSIQGNISALVEAGYRIAIDDFGTGFSNLSRLAQLDIHILKFDISITRMIDKDGRNEFILGLIKLFHGKGMKILFEGVESQDIASLLDKIGADYIQGYLYSPPRPEEVFLSLLD